jgi:hypothetical protein
MLMTSYFEADRSAFQSIDVRTIPLPSPSTHGVSAAVKHPKKRKKKKKHVSMSAQLHEASSIQKHELNQHDADRGSP